MHAATQQSSNSEAGQEDQARADVYALLARMFLQSPNAELMRALADLPVPSMPSRPLDCAWDALARAAQHASLQAVREEYDQLFTGIGTPQLNPFASLYLAGFINEKPLVRLRSDLARLGLARRHDSRELEDHFGVLCETMRILIEGAQQRAPQPLDVQEAFFSVHIAPWYERLMHDVRMAQGADFYKRVADLADVFLAIEAQAFEVADEEA